MAKEVKFEGFSKKTVSFFRNLKKNNTKEWFDKHRADYDEYVVAPSRMFVTAMGEKLSWIYPDIVADPRVNKSLFRINRDVRFSKDKSPYKTNLGLWMWEGPLKRMENSGCYFHFDPPNLMFGVGLYMFPKPHLEQYRDSVVHPKYGPELAKAVKALEKKKYNVGGQHYKRVPRGYDPDHKYGELLLHNGLYAGFETKIPDEFYSAKLVNYCFKHYKSMIPLHKWLLAMTKRL